MNSYTEEYYKNLNYSNYLSRHTRYLKLAEETVELLKKINLISSKPVLDFGCATGFLVDGLIKQNIDAYGYDISNWAISQAKQLVGENRASTKLFAKSFSMVYFLDVLEHFESEQDLHSLFSTIDMDSFIFRIPVCLEKNGRYVLDVSENDKTHNIRWTKKNWIDFFKSYGFMNFKINLKTIYDDQGVFCGLGVKI